MCIRDRPAVVYALLQLVAGRETVLAARGGAAVRVALAGGQGAHVEGPGLLLEGGDPFRRRLRSRMTPHHALPLGSSLARSAPRK
eukprot:230907-Pyramimonas_sp.AAC.1